MNDLSVFPIWEFGFSKSTKMVVSSSAGISVACPFSYYSEVAIRHPIKPKTVRSTVLSYIILVKVFQTQGQNDPELLAERFVMSDLWIYQGVAKITTPSILLNVLNNMSVKHRFID